MAYKIEQILETPDILLGPSHNDMQKAIERIIDGIQQDLVLRDAYQDLSVLEIMGSSVMGGCGGYKLVNRTERAYLNWLFGKKKKDLVIGETMTRDLAVVVNNAVLEALCVKVAKENGKIGVRRVISA